MRQGIYKKTLSDICEEAMKVGLDIDLTDCPYGETTVSGFIDRPTSYYHFLAGLVRIEKMTNILETGTNFGGSIMAIAKGINELDIPKSRIVTIDIMLKNEAGFRKYPNVKRLHGDSLHNGIIYEAVGYFDRDIDLLYIDSLHQYGHTKGNIEVYGAKLNPKYIILDDIRQCEDMISLWQELNERFGENAFDASETARRRGAGFGVIRYR